MTARGFAKNRLTKFRVSLDVKAGWTLIIDDNSLAFRLGIRNKTLQYLLRLRNKGEVGLKKKQGEMAFAYHCFSNKILNEDGTVRKERPIQEPMPLLKNIHKVLNGLFSDREFPQAVTAYVKGLSIDMAARQHVRPSYWYAKSEKIPKEVAEDPRYTKVKRHKIEHDPTSEEGLFYFQPTIQIHLDIKNFFNSIRASWVRKFFYDEIGYCHNVAFALAQLCTVKIKERRFLPQGSPLSGSLANLVAYQRFGGKIEELLATLSPDWVWTIYSDDIVMSHPEQTITPEQVLAVKDAVSKLVERAGFRINQDKTTVKNSKEERLTILGFTVNEKLNIQKSTYTALKSLLTNCVSQGWDAQARRLHVKNGIAVLQYVRGKLQSIRKAVPERYAELDQIFQKALQAFPPNPTQEMVLRQVREETYASSDGAHAAEVSM